MARAPLATSCFHRVHRLNVLFDAVRSMNYCLGFITLSLVRVFPICMRRNHGGERGGFTSVEVTESKPQMHETSKRERGDLLPLCEA